MFEILTSGLFKDKPPGKWQLIVQGDRTVLKKCATDHSEKSAVTYEITWRYFTD